MAQQIPLSPDGRVDPDAHHDDTTHQLAADLAYKRLAIVNAVYFGVPGAADRHWVLIDTGIIGTTGLIARAAAKRFGEDRRPTAIIMTHGHFDHIGGLRELAERWQVPIYAHSLEFPYLDGRSSYPPADPTVGGGLMTTLSPLFPRGPIDVSGFLHHLPEDGTVPGMPGWQWIHTPGHSPGHVSLWREADWMIIAGDAFITTAQESAYSALTQQPEMHGPPKYYTPDWESARESVRKLAALEPNEVVTGHGPAMSGAEMRSALHLLARLFDEVAVPEHGRYVHEPARADESGPTYIPPKS